jgi:nucleotide-binding universal stress UspA family protein
MVFDRIAAEGGRVIVAGVDGSDSSWRATAYAVGLARRQNALLVLVHVLPVHPTAVVAGVAWMLTDSDMSLAKQLRQRVATGLGCMGEAHSLRWEFHVVAAADPVAGLSRAADELRADTVVVGASERLWHRVAGSAGVRMVKAGRWPVVVVP